MIWEWLLSQLVGIEEWLGAQLQSLIPPVPDWVMTLGDQIAVIGGYIGAMSVWVPVEMLAITLVVIVGALGAGLAIKIARIVASFLTIGGGSAG